MASGPRRLRASSSSIRSNKEISSDIICLTKSELTTKLNRYGIDHDSYTTNDELRALLALTELGLLRKDEHPNTDLLETVAAWSKMSIPELCQETRKWGSPTYSHKKSVLIKQLILIKLDDGIPDVARKAVASKKQSKHVVVSSHHHLVVNLLLAILFTDRLTREQVVLLPHWFPSPAAMQDLINELDIPDSHSLTTALTSPSSPSQRFLTKVSLYLTGQFTHLSNSASKLPGFPDSVPQFSINTTTAALEAQFQEAKRQRGGTSRILFHGTPLHNLRSILRNGFLACSHGNGVWLAEEPIVSYVYASRATGEAYEISSAFPKALKVEDWNNSPYKGYGALLACEAAGNGSPSRHRNYATHVITDLKSVIPRYVFLLPPKVLRDGNGCANRLTRFTRTSSTHVPPQRKDIVPKIEAGIALRR